MKRTTFYTFLILLVFGFSYAENPHQEKGTTPTNKSNKIKKTLPNNTAPIPVSITSIPEIKSTNKEEKSNWNSENIAHLGVDIIMMFITGALACYTLGLFRQTKNLARDSNEQGKNFKNHSERELRAYVFTRVNDNECAKLLITRGNAYLTLLPFIKNSGKTPAYNVRYDIFGWVQSHPVPTNFKYPTYPAKDYAFTALGPGQERQMEYEMPVVKADWFNEFINSQKEKIYVCGVVIYDDAFGIRRESEFSYWLTMANRVGIISGRNEFKCEWRQTKDHNGAN